MVRANIKYSDDVYIGLIDQDDDGFRIIWNRNINNYPDANRTGSDKLFPTFADACQGVYQVLSDAKISETIYFKPRKQLKSNNDIH